PLVSSSGAGYARTPCAWQPKAHPSLCTILSSSAGLSLFRAGRTPCRRWHTCRRERAADVGGATVAAQESPASRRALVPARLPTQVSSLMRAVGVWPRHRGSLPPAVGFPLPVCLSTRRQT